ncbi:hypothetical protein HDU98_004937, partial [Podochytrium sp. JEL0797]
DEIAGPAVVAQKRKREDMGVQNEQRRKRQEMMDSFVQTDPEGKIAAVAWSMGYLVAGVVIGVVGSGLIC